MKTVTIKVKGMMCAHCEKHVADAVKALPGVEDCKADKDAASAVVTLSGEVAVADIVKAIEDAGYEAEA